MAISKRARRWAGAIALVAIAIGSILAARPAYHLVTAIWNDRNEPDELPPGFVEDASRRNQTLVREIWNVPAEREEAERQLASLLRRAKAEGLKVAIGGARHSMGGHTIYPGGIAINMLPFNDLALDEQTNILRAGSGARWSEIIPFLDSKGRSVAVMQSNNSFSVGGSISVNCHGWQYGRPPIASTVESFRLMRADGTVVRCSRVENQELFSLVLGGYGLFGVLLDIELRVVPNQRLRLEQYVVPSEDALATFDEKIGDRPDVGMAYGRLCIVPDTMCEQIIINVLYHDPNGEPPELKAKEVDRLRRAIFRGSAESDYGKDLRWHAETKVQPWLATKVFSRNQLLNEGVEVFQNRSADTTDILHEYFVPSEEITKFVPRLARIVRDRKANLLNVTVRSVRADEDAFLRYADRDMFAFVLLFNQPRTPLGDEEMETMTQQLIDASLASNGRYYLPYRLHATQEQFQRAYPMAKKFFALKRQYDPDELFQNQFYEKYGKD